MFARRNSSVWEPSGSLTTVSGRCGLGVGIESGSSGLRIRIASTARESERLIDLPPGDALSWPLETGVVANAGGPAWGDEGAFAAAGGRRTTWTVPCFRRIAVSNLR